MGTYATTTTLALTMIGVTFDSNTTSMISKMIDRAESAVNQGLSKRYDISSSYFQTTSSIPPAVRSMTEILAEGLAWKSLSRGAKESLSRGQSMIDEVMGKSTGMKQLGDNGLLFQFASYKADLLTTIGAVIPDKSTSPFRVQSTNTDYTETFAEDEETAWVVDPDKLDDISDTRS